MSQVLKMTNTRQGVTVTINEEFYKGKATELEAITDSGKPYYQIVASDVTGRFLVHEGQISFKRAVEIATAYGVGGGWE